MSYIYTIKNGLENPNTYMYADFEGESLLQNFFSSRIQLILTIVDSTAIINQCLINGTVTQSTFRFNEIMHQFNESLLSRELIPYYKAFNDIDDSFIKKNDHLRNASKCCVDCNSVDISQQIETRELINTLFIQMVHNEEFSAFTEFWLDKLVQKFEVTKKLYEFYPPGFKKGFGRIDDLSLYALFSFVLCIHYDSVRNYKYLSTILKVNDLLCSVIKSVVCSNEAKIITLLSLLCEHVFITDLTKRKGLHNEIA
jgi:hypothetical protein